MSELASDLLFIILILLVTAIIGIFTGYVIGLIKHKKATLELEKRVDVLETELLASEKDRESIENKSKKAQEDFERKTENLHSEIASYKDQFSQLNTSNDDFRKKSEEQIAGLEEELLSYRSDKIELERKTQELISALDKVKAKEKEGGSDTTFTKQAQKKGLGAINLKLIEGIGPKIEQILKQEGIDTWVKLSLTNPDEIRSVLISKGGSAYRVHDPRTWPFQAKLASEDRWKELKEFQDNLSVGK